MMNQLCGLDDLSFQVEAKLRKIVDKFFAIRASPWKIWEPNAKGYGCEGHAWFTGMIDEQPISAYTFGRKDNHEKKGICLFDSEHYSQGMGHHSLRFNLQARIEPRLHLGG